MLYKFLDLKRKDKLLLFKAFLLLGGIRLALWTLPFRTLQVILEEGSSRIAGTEAYHLPPERIAWAVGIISPFIPKATCFSQALAAYVLLASYGYKPSLQIGVARGDNYQLEAHAWVESRGKVIIGGSEIDRFTRLPPFKRDR
jgi:hypothetical protein